MATAVGACPDGYADCETSDNPKYANPSAVTAFRNLAEMHRGRPGDEPPSLLCRRLSSAASGDVGQRVHVLAEVLDDEVDVGTGRHAGASHEADPRPWKTAWPTCTGGCSAMCPYRVSKPCTMVDLHVVAQPAVAPAREGHRAAVRCREWRVHRRREVVPLW